MTSGREHAIDAAVGLGELDLAQLCLENLAANDADRVFFKDEEGRFLMVSDGWLRTCGGGQEREEVIGRTDHDFFSAEHADLARADDLQVMRTGRPLVGKLELETFPDRPDALVSTTKLPLRAACGRIIGTYGVSRGITNEVSQRAAAYHASRDPVTDLLTRTAFHERLTGALRRRRDTDEQIAIIVLDLDGFREVNETLGRDLGDELLREFGARLHAAARSGDDVSRFGADRFAIMCAPVQNGPDAQAIAERLRQALLAPLLGPHQQRLGISVGVALSRRVDDDPAALVTRAEAAVERAKVHGGDRSHLFAGTRVTTASAALTLGEELRRAIEEGQLFLEYQPVVSLAGGRVKGVEALVRWHHPTRGVVGPGAFIPEAERCGLIADIDMLVLSDACRALADWRERDRDWQDRIVAVNLSAAGLHRREVVAGVLERVMTSGIPPAQLCIEVTETAMIGDLDNARRVIDELTDAGVRVALDDFGTGFSSLSHLQHLSAGELKIDRSFVSRLTGRRRDRELVKAVCGMAHALEMTVVAEGVETGEHHRLLSELACDKVQGFLYARPVGGDALREAIERIETGAFAGRTPPA